MVTPVFAQQTCNCVRLEQAKDITSCFNIEMIGLYGLDNLYSKVEKVGAYVVSSRIFNNRVP